jgi:hypothetical protein
VRLQFFPKLLESVSLRLTCSLSYLETSGLYTLLANERFLRFKFFSAIPFQSLGFLQLCPTLRLIRLYGTLVDMPRQVVCALSCRDMVAI